MRLLDFQTPLPAEGIDSRRAKWFVSFARLLLFWERIWPALWPSSGFIGIYAALALTGAFSELPPPLHALILVFLFGAAAFALWWNLERIRLPNWDDAARRIEQDSGLAHRPISEIRDHISAGRDDELAETLWRIHILRLLSSVERLRFVPASSGLRKRDPHDLRWLVLVIVIGAFFVSGSDWKHRLVTGLAPAPPASILAIALNAWISPPSYTGLAPHAIGAEPTGYDHGSTVVAPRGSTLILRVRGARTQPTLSLRPKNHQRPVFQQSEGSHQAQLKLQEDSHVSVSVGGRNIGDWRFRITPDNKPAIALTEQPTGSSRGMLRLAYRASDDYGVMRVEARITLAGQDSDMKTQLVKGIGPLIFELPVPTQNRKFSQASLRDLTGHPYSGMKVQIRLVAIDGAGQITETPPRIITLPERIFTHPLARALIEQRRILASGAPDAKDRTAAAVDALTIGPERFYHNDFKTYLAMRALYWRIRTIRDDKDVLEAINYMWDMAVALEEGDVRTAAETLRNAQRALMDALQRGASEAEISALMQKLREALAKYLNSLAQNAPQNGAVPPGTRMLRSGDLDQILKAIEEMSRSGARQSAQQLLQGLAELLENLRVTRSSEPSPADKAISDAVKGLSELMGQQRELLDRTFREEETGKPRGDGLANDQRNLNSKLGKITEGLGQKGVKAPDNLGQAQQEMNKSEQNLRSGQAGISEFSQQNALEQLREGAKALAKQMTETSNMAETNGSLGEDPLGRDSGAVGAAFGNSVKVPQQSDLQRAREILQELRKRAGEQTRSKEELDYINRLLKQF